MTRKQWCFLLNAELNLLSWNEKTSPSGCSKTSSLASSWVVSGTAPRGYGVRLGRLWSEPTWACTWLGGTSHATFLMRAPHFWNEEHSETHTGHFGSYSSFSPGQACTRLILLPSLRNRSTEEKSTIFFLTWGNKGTKRRRKKLQHRWPVLLKSMPGSEWVKRRPVTERASGGHERYSIGSLVNAITIVLCGARWQRHWWWAQHNVRTCWITVLYAWN